MNYSLIFWGNSSYNCKLFRMQRKAIRIIMGCKIRGSSCNLFKKLRILPLKSHYISSLLLFVVSNKDQIIVKLENYSINTRQSTNLHLPQEKLALYKKGVYYLGIKIYNNLASDIKNFSNNPKKFKTVLKHFLYTNCFYSLDKYFNVNKEKSRHFYKEFCIAFSWFGILFDKYFLLCIVSYLYISSHAFNILSYINCNTFIVILL
jgi:hypothetical protein